MKKSFYITTTLPYVNAKPHIGFALEVVRADVIARYHRLNGDDVFFNTGTDEHGLKIYQKATESGKTAQEFTDEMVKNFYMLREKLNLSYDRFIRTTDHDHVLAAQEFWKICKNNGFIYKKNYKGLYCVGCEKFVTEKDLIEGKCPDHSDRKPIEIEEENYFFKYSAFQDDLIKHYNNHSNFVIPSSRQKEILNFVSGGLEDFSISRIKEKMPWGIPVPDDDEQVMYVWFDALVNYISTIGWPNDTEAFEKFWNPSDTNGPVQYCGKDNLHFQAARWQAMLLAAKLPLSKHIVINGFITSGGQKMSKSIGNVIDPVSIVNEFGTDALRYFLLREINPFEDSDFTIEKFRESYNANLANGLGNVTSRVMKMCEDNLKTTDDQDLIEKLKYDEFFTVNKNSELKKLVDKAISDFNLQKATDYIWQELQKIDVVMAEKQPYKMLKSDDTNVRNEALKILIDLRKKLAEIALILEPFLPESAEKIKYAIAKNKKPEKPLFERK